MAATASYLDARARKGQWMVRIDDLDQPRNMVGADKLILQALEDHALFWDGEVVHQSDHQERYQEALLKLREQVFYCTCSRQNLQGRPGYPGTCRNHRQPRTDSAIRIQVPDRSIEFDDLIMGRRTDNLAQSVGDFIIRRRDGLIAYQLATAVDDGSSSITHVVRGSDLLDNTARQIFLMQALGLPVPRYAHVPTLLSPTGQKLSKQHGAPAIDCGQATANLAKVMRLLGMEPGAQAERWQPQELLAWGIEHWQLTLVPDTNAIVEL